MSASQLLSPRGLTATSKLFEYADHTSDSARICALRGEDINIGLGINNINVLGSVGEFDENLYEFCHTEEGGGIPVKMKMTKKRRRDEMDVDGDFVAVDHYHLDYDGSSEEDEDTGIAQGGVELDVPTPFPNFGTLSPVDPPLSGTFQLTGEI